MVKITQEVLPVAIFETHSFQSIRLEFLVSGMDISSKVIETSVFS